MMFLIRLFAPMPDSSFSGNDHKVTLADLTPYACWIVLAKMVPNLLKCHIIFYGYAKTYFSHALCNK